MLSRLLRSRRSRAWVVFLLITSPLALLLVPRESSIEPKRYYTSDVVILGKVNSHSCGDDPEEGVAIEIHKVVSDPNQVLKESGRVSGPFPKAYVLVPCGDMVSKVIQRFELREIFKIRLRFVLTPISGSELFRIESVSRDD